jgi:DNA-directed RNA polymerase subunit RPC12/RpoP
MPKTFAYVCGGCEFDTIAGVQLWECPYCGGRLTLMKMHTTEDPREAYVARATEDVIQGLEKMLEEGGPA